MVNGFITQLVLVNHVSLPVSHFTSHFTNYDCVTRPPASIRHIVQTTHLFDRCLSALEYNMAFRKMLTSF